jgi:SAM-dependent methyltransferase
VRLVGRVRTPIHSKVQLADRIAPTYLPDLPLPDLPNDALSSQGMNRPYLWLALLVAVLATVNANPSGQAAPAKPQKRADAPHLAPFVPTPQEVVDRMLQLADVKKTDVVYDLGCGDGRIPITAAKVYGARGVGVDIDPQRIAESNANAKAAGVTHLVTFKLQDALTTDVSEATVLMLYLLSSSNLKLRPILTKQLKPGTRIVAHNFGMGDWEPDKTDSFTDSAGSRRTLYLWKFDGKVRP